MHNDSYTDFYEPVKFRRHTYEKGLFRKTKILTECNLFKCQITNFPFVKVQIQRDMYFYMHHK